MTTPTPTRSTSPDSLRTRPLTQFQGIVIALTTFFLLLAFSLPLTVGQYRLDEAQDRLAQADQRACELRATLVDEHNTLARSMADIERQDTTHSAQQREQTAQAWEDSLLPPPEPC